MRTLLDPVQLTLDLVGSIDQAHAPVEWVDVNDIRLAVPLYTAIAHRAAGGLGAGDQELR